MADMKGTLLLATTNEGKSRELAELLAAWGGSFVNLTAYPNLAPVVEDGESFLANALKKARAAAAATGLPALADDSGLECLALGGWPGLYSARFAGGDLAPGEPFSGYTALAQALAGLPPARRRLRMRCVLAVARPDGRAWWAEGSCEGLFVPPRGSGGFGFDPVFYLPQEGKTFGELPAAVKQRLSHRAKAAQALLPLLQREFAF